MCPGFCTAQSAAGPQQGGLFSPNSHTCPESAQPRVHLLPEQGVHFTFSPSPECCSEALSDARPQLTAEETRNNCPQWQQFLCSETCAGMEQQHLLAEGAPLSSCRNPLPTAEPGAACAASWRCSCRVLTRWCQLCLCQAGASPGLPWRGRSALGEARAGHGSSGNTRLLTGPGAAGTQHC